jgi:hypothetical protein
MPCTVPSLLSLSAIAATYQGSRRYGRLLSLGHVLVDALRMSTMSLTCDSNGRRHTQPWGPSVSKHPRLLLCFPVTTRRTFDVLPAAPRTLQARTLISEQDRNLVECRLAKSACAAEGAHAMGVVSLHERQWSPACRATGRCVPPTRLTTTRASPFWIGSTGVGSISWR